MRHVDTTHGSRTLAGLEVIGQFLFSALLELADMRAEPLEEHRQRLEQLLHCKASSAGNR